MLPHRIIPAADINIRPYVIQYYKTFRLTSTHVDVEGVGGRRVIHECWGSKSVRSKNFRCHPKRKEQTTRVRSEEMVRIVASVERADGKIVCTK